MRYLIFTILCFGSFSSCKKKYEITTTVTPGPVVDTIGNLFHNAYRVYDMQRNAKGIYRDSKLFAGTDYHPASVANIGIGLVSLCIADKMQWITNAKAQAITTLETLLGKDPIFKLEKNAAGFPRHFVKMETGEREWNSEYSTIDAALMASGALFCKKYFSTDAPIKMLADSLYRSINWVKAIADPATGKIYLTLDAAGNGTVGTTTNVFNEYMLVAYLAYKSEKGNGGPATTLWNNFYANAANLPKSDYQGISVLTDKPGSFLSDFIPQQCYYLCNPFTTNSEYLNYLTSAMTADKKWWSLTDNTAVYDWGLGAGSAKGGSGYGADKINFNADKIVSPHIISGFIPVNSASTDDLKDMYKAGKGRYKLPGTNYEILWRYSVSDANWRANEVQGIDYSSMLFGLASLPQHCGSSFFSTYNNYDFP